MKELDVPETVTDEQLDALMDDWFDRDGTTFVHKRKEGRLDWEKTLAVDAAYSEYMLATDDVKEVIRKAYSLGRDTLIAMNLPRKVQVVISPTDTSATSGKVVFLSTKVFDETAMEVGERLDVFLGFAVHEGCHVLWTDFSVLPESTLRKHICNILEDERIEALCGEDKPGFANFLEKTKAYYFDLYYKRVTEKYHRETLLEQFMDMLLKIVRFPKYLDEALFIKFYKYLVRIKEILVPYPKSTRECSLAAAKIEKIIREFYEDEMSKPKSSSGAESRSSDSGDPSSESSDGASSEESSEDDEKPSGDDTVKEEPKTVSPAEVSSAIAEDLKSSRLKETLRILGEEHSPGSDTSKVILADSEFAEVVEGSITLGSSKDVIFTKATGDYSRRYDKSYEKVSRYVPAVNRILKSYSQEYRYILRGMRSGKLDVNKLSEAYQGVPTVYLREGEVTVEDVCVCLLIDESGSMCGSKAEAARDTGVLINEAIGKVPNVDLFIYGHTGDIRRRGTTEITVYREHGFSPRKALGQSEAHAQNRDGTAIYEVAKRVRKQTKRPVLMFVISDGAPAALGYGGKEAIDHTRQMVERVEKMDFSVVQICIDPSYDPALMFRHFVILKDMSTLSLDLSKVIKAALLRHVKKVSTS